MSVDTVEISYNSAVLDSGNANFNRTYAVCGDSVDIVVPIPPFPAQLRKLDGFIYRMSDTVSVLCTWEVVAMDNVHGTDKSDVIRDEVVDFV